MNALHVAERSAVYALEDTVAPAADDAFELLTTAPQGVAKLRQLILSLAIQGRLCRRGGTNGGSTDQPFDTPKEPRETPSCADRDTPARQRDMGVIGPFHIPATWQWSALGEVVDVIRGITFPASEKRKSPDEGLIACLRTANVQNVIEWDDLLYVNRSFMRRDDQRVRPMDIIMSMANSKDLVGKVALVDDGPPKEATIGGFIAILRTQDMDPRYLMGVLRSDYVRLTLIDSSSQTTNIANISLAKLRPLPIPLPPLAEQRRIVARVEELMGLCDELETRGRLQDEQHARLVATLFDALVASASPAELADNWQRVARHFDLLLDRPEAVDALEQTILQLAVRGLLVPQDPADEPANELLSRIRAEKEKLAKSGQIKQTKTLRPVTESDGMFSIPAPWVWTRFGELVNHSEAGWSPRCDGGQRRGDAWGVLKVSAVSWGEFRSHENKQLPASLKPRAEYEVHDGDFLISRANTAELVARSVVAERPEPRLMLSDKLIRLGVSTLAERRYVNLVNNVEYARAYYAENASGTSGSMKNVSREVILNLPVPLPPLAEQHRIVARVEALRRLCANLRQHLQQAQTIQSNLADALVGAAVQSDTAVPG